MTNTEGEDFIQTRSAESGNRGTREMITECPDMVELVAKAIALSHEGRNWDTMMEHGREWWRKSARAAIEAMRHPTDEMWEGWRSINCTKGANGFEEFTSFEGDYGNWLTCHIAMIDAALVGAACEQE